MRHLSGFDALFVYDDGPRETQHTIKVCFLSEEASRGYDFESAKAHLGTRLVKIPPLRWQVARIPFDLHHPVWIEAEAIDLDHHVRCRRLPDAAGRDELCRAISEIATEVLDPARPLWESWFLEGYEGNKVVIVLKVSHALADGGSIVDLFQHAMFAHPTEPEVAANIERAIADAMPPLEARPGRLKLFCLGAGELLRDIFLRMPRLLGATLRARRRQREARGQVPRPGFLDMPPHAFGGPLTPGRAFYFTTVPLASVRGIAKTCGATINDVVLTVAAGALRNYLKERAALPDVPLVASMAASIRQPDQRGAWGNHVTNRTFRLPTHLADPLERLRYARLEADAVKSDVALGGRT
jgi:diacylglycerol O-acyltransferase / wax synthase